MQGCPARIGYRVGQHSAVAKNYYCSGQKSKVADISNILRNIAPKYKPGTSLNMQHTIDSTIHSIFFIQLIFCSLKAFIINTNNTTPPFPVNR